MCEQRQVDVLLEGRHGLRVGGHPEDGTALIEAQNDPAGQGLQLLLRELQLVRAQECLFGLCCVTSLGLTNRSSSCISELHPLILARKMDKRNDRVYICT